MNKLLQTHSEAAEDAEILSISSASQGCAVLSDVSDCFSTSICPLCILVMRGVYILFNRNIKAIEITLRSRSLSQSRHSHGLPGTSLSSRPARKVAPLTACQERRPPHGLSKRLHWLPSPSHAPSCPKCLQCPVSTSAFVVPCPSVQESCSHYNSFKPLWRLI